MSRTTSRWVLVLCALALAGVACGTASGVDVVRVQREDVEVRPTPSPVPTFVHPLTGEVYEGPQTWQERRALVVKVENSRMSRPQAGLDDADLVYEEPVEGGITRFVVVFHTRQSERVGPVRSARHVDIDIAAPLNPLFGYSGAVPAVVSAVRAAPTITDVGVDRASGYYRDRNRPSPHNLYTSTAALWEGRAGDPPQPFFSFLPEGADPTAGGEPGGSTSFTFAPAGEETSFTYDRDDGVYRRAHRGVPHTVEGDVHLGFTNVIIQRVPMPGGAPSVLGEGEAILLRNGYAFRGTWTRGSQGEPTRFVDAAGEPLLLSPGTTWVALVPAGRPVAVS